eukprot:symbB.v1.2.028033.t2/scaffold2926.1/size67079/6
MEVEVDVEDIVTRDDGVVEVSGNVENPLPMELLSEISVPSDACCCKHLFHVRCILVWSEVENSCPQCRSRFLRFGEYNISTGKLRKFCEVQKRDQIEQSSSEEVLCDVCGRGDEEDLLLLCDGRRGRCPGACHTFCDGLGRQVPRGRWLCLSCRPRPRPRGRRQTREPRERAEISPGSSKTETQGSSQMDLEGATNEASVPLPRLPPQSATHLPAESSQGADPCILLSVKAEGTEQADSVREAEAPSRVKRESEQPDLQNRRFAESQQEQSLLEQTEEKKLEEADKKEACVACSTPVFHQLKAFQASIDLDSEEEPKEPEKPPVLRRRYHILSLPQELEDWAEQVRKFASTYFLCERSMPLANRTAERLWRLCQVGTEEAGFLVESDERRCRQLLCIAKDSFQLFWQQPLDPGDDDPCGLRCLRSKSEALLCVRYTGPRGKRGRIRPSDIVRCELQCRRRLLELWDTGHFDHGFGALPMIDLPLQEVKAKTQGPQGDIPRARASVAVDHLNHLSQPMRLSGMDLINELKKQSWYFNQAVHVSQTAARTARFMEPKAVLHPILKEVLLESLRNRSCALGEGDSTLKLYSHQAEAIDAVLLNKQDVVVSTSTGSGKSLVYLTAIFEALLRRENATAILIFPTKALAQDQLRTLKDLAQALVNRGICPENLSIACLDGDTPGAERARVRKEARVDMLHSHVLPQHIEYSRLLHNICYVVLDEVHVYRGAFGANVCSVIRRHSGDVSVLAFCKWRSLVEIVLQDVKDAQLERDIFHRKAMWRESLDARVTVLAVFTCKDHFQVFEEIEPGDGQRFEEGSEYNVMQLDVQRRRAVVKKCDAPLPYYTRAFDSTVVRIQTRERHVVSGEAKVFLGEMELESRVKSFKRFWKSQDVPQEAEVELNLPSWGYTSRGLWFEDPLGVAQPERLIGEEHREQKEWTWGCGWAGAHAAMHALLKVFPLFVLADRQDLDAACVDEHGLPPMDRPRLMIFDAKDGGLGLCDAAFQHGFAILREARRLVTTLPELFHKTVAAFEDAGLEPSKSEVRRRVQVEASLNHEQSYEVLRLLHELEECDDIGEVHHNAVFADDCELQYGNYGVVLEYSKAYKK